MNDARLRASQLDPLASAGGAAGTSVVGAAAVGAEPTFEQPARERPKIVDVRGLGCGSVLMALANHRRSLDAPAQIVVWTDDAAADEELPAWCRMTRQSYLGRVPTVEGAGRHLLALTALPALTAPPAPAALDARGRTGPQAFAQQPPTQPLAAPPHTTPQTKDSQ